MLRPLLLSVICALGITSGLHAQSDSTIAIGFTTRLHSTILDEDRPVLVHLPPGYGNPNARYPVLYLLDGETHFNYAAGVVDYLAATGRAPAMIVIALPNTDRTRDLTPLARSDSAFLSLPDGGRQWIKFPGQGGASDFRRFLTEELAPWVEARYAAESYRILAGHSFGGLFAIDAALTHPESFNAYIAASPALWWDDRRLIDSAPALLGDGRLDGRFIFMSMGDEGPDMNVHVERLAEIFDARGSAGLTWAYEPMLPETHATTPLRTLYDGLELLFQGWQLPDALILAGDVTKIDAHFAGLKARFGFPDATPEPLLNQMGYAQLELGNVQDAIALFRENARRFPGSANVYDSLGDGLRAAGDLEAAIVQYETAVRLATAAHLPTLAALQANLDSARAQLTAK